jgi:glycine cleavage system regulatory protein
VDALIQPIEYRFETYITNIEASKQRIFELRDAANTAQQTDMKVAIDDTSRGMFRATMSGYFFKLKVNDSNLEAEG